MAETILDYLTKTKEETLLDRPFCEVDSLILSQFSYLKFDGILPMIGDRDKAITICDILTHPDYSNIYADERYKKNNVALFEGMVLSKRFNRMKIHSYVNIIDYEAETQFAALTCEFENGTTYVAFRGTDDTLVGWKEDLNMALSVPVPGQIRSVDYLESIAPTLPGDFIVGGHSKGGNLAVFSAMYCSREVQDRITHIFNHDGPGFRNEILDDEKYMAIRDRINMTVPYSSIVGMLLVNYDNYKVVDSKSVSILQHDPFNWKLEGNDFKQKDGVKEGRALADRSINEWVMGLEQDQIKLFVDTVYDLMLATNAQNLNEIKDNWQQIIHNVSEAIKDIDPETKEMMYKIVYALYEQGTNNTKEEINNRIAELKEYMTNAASSASEKAKEFLQALEGQGKK